MAPTPKPHTLADGTIVYRVKFHLGGKQTGKSVTETFNPVRNPGRNLDAAVLFANALAANGYQWPPNYLPGIGFVSAAEMARLTAPEEPDGAPKGAGISVRDYSEKWLKAQSGVQSDTLGKYRRILERDVLPWFGAADVADTEAISPLTIGAWVNELRDGRAGSGDEEWERDPLSPKSIRNIHGLFYAVMQSVVDTDPPLRARNPCAGTGLPKLEDDEGDEEMVFLTPEEYDLIDGRLAFDPMARKLARFLVGTGMRYSEATALQVRDFEDLLGKPKARVKRAWKQDGRGAYILGAPKTKAARRGVRLSEEQVDMVLPILSGKAKTDLVFTGPAGGRFSHATFYTGRWLAACYMAMRCEACREQDHKQGIARRGPTTVRRRDCVWCGHAGQLEQYPRVHDLRHTQVAWAIASGAPLLAISRRLGHASIKITQDRYGHLLPEVEDDLVVNLAALMNRGRERSALFV